MRFVCFLIVFLMPVSIFAQDAFLYLDIEGFNPTVYDARARAMGRTGIVTATGSNAIFFNPANIGMLTNNSIQGGARGWFGTVDNSDMTSDIDDFDLRTKYPLHPKITHLSFAKPYHPANSELKFAFGIGYNTYMDVGANIHMETEYRQPGNVNDITLDIKSHGGLNTISPAAAININDRYFLGMAFHKSVLEKVSVVGEYDFDPQPSGDTIIREEEEMKGSASFIMLGGTAKFTPEFTVGLTYRSGFKYKFTDREWSWEEEDGDRGKDTDIDDMDFQLPSIFGLGVSYQVTPNVLFAAEYQNRPFSDIEIDGQKIFGIDDGSSYRIGVEFQYTTRVRLGYFSDAVLATDENQYGESRETPKSMKGITFGLGAVSGNTAVDFFGEFAYYSQDFYEPSQDNVYEYKEKRLMFGLTITYTIPNK